MFQQILPPEIPIGLGKVSALVAAVAVHPVRVNHELEAGALLVEHINQL